MREIFFRGKTKDGVWYHGFIKGKSLPNYERNKLEFTPCIIEQPYADIWVIPETVGQYTGLTDKNGTKIFEGDILKFAYNAKDKEPKFYSIEWKEDRACFGYAETADKMIEIDCFHCEVIGNIHDNPELLEVGNNA